MQISRYPVNHVVVEYCSGAVPVKLLPVPVILFFRSRRDLLLENFALQQQLAVLKRRDPRPRMAVSDRLFWVLLRRFWSPWKQALILVQPEIIEERGGLKELQIQAFECDFVTDGNGRFTEAIFQSVKRPARILAEMRYPTGLAARFAQRNRQFSVCGAGSAPHDPNHDRYA
jgi:hypothetical protein